MPLFQVTKNPPYMMNSPVKKGDVFRMLNSSFTTGILLERPDGSQFEMNLSLFRDMCMQNIIEPAEGTAKILFGDK